MGARRPVAMGLLFGFMVALWRNYLDAREIRHRIGATTQGSYGIRRSDQQTHPAP